MASQSLPCTVSIDVSALAAKHERKDVVDFIVNRFSTYSVEAVQFVGTIGKITFGSK